MNPYACTASAYLTPSHFPSLCVISSRKIPGENEQPGEFGSGLIAELLKDLEPLGSAVMSPGRGEFVEMSPGKRESALFNGFSSRILVNFFARIVWRNGTWGKRFWEVNLLAASSSAVLGQSSGKSSLSSSRLPQASPAA